jgi:4'-phosphopantetheinyl transferase
MAQRCFSVQELKHWQQLTEPDKTNTFYRYWCAKEAFLKASGRGLALGMQHCIINLNQACFVKLPEAYLSSGWQLDDIDVGNNYRAYVANSGNSVSIINKQFE